jgi:hypothetical protein
MRTVLAFIAGYITAAAVIIGRARIRWWRWVMRSRKQPRWLRDL